MPTLTLPDFVNKWRNAGLTERAGAQMHFIELCDVLVEPHPASEDFSGATDTFEKGGTTIEGKQGFADVWKRGCFGWEYKGKHKDLNVAYQQLLKYREDLENPPLLVVCDLELFEVHTNFTGTAKQVYRFSLDDLLKNQATADCKLPPIEVLRAVFTDPARLRPDRSTADVTEMAAAEFATLADSLRARGVDPQRAAHFLMRLLFCLYAEDIGLLPAKLFSVLLERTRRRPAYRLLSAVYCIYPVLCIRSAEGANFCPCSGRGWGARSPSNLLPQHDRLVWCNSNGIPRRRRRILSSMGSHSTRQPPFLVIHWR